MKWIRKILGIEELVKKQEETNALLKEIVEHTKRNANLQQKYNEAYHIR